MHKIKLLAIISIIFLFANGLIYYTTELNKEQRVKLSIDANLKNIETHYKILLYNQKLIAYAAYASTIQNSKIINILSKVAKANEKEKNILRKKLYKILENKYKIMKTKGILQYQFVLPSNKSFLRMHKPNRFGDDLSEVRADFKYTNETKHTSRGFVQGRVEHGFRNVFPIFNNEKYLGAVEISFSSNHFQKYLNNISKIHTHFLLNKKIFDAKVWKRDDLVVKYLQSSEHKDYMLSMNDVHTKQRCIIDNHAKLSTVKDKITKGINSGNKFAVYYINDYDNVGIVSFFPIQSINKSETLAWLVSYEKSDFLYSTFKGNIIVQIVSFLIFLLIGYLTYKNNLVEQIVKKDHKLLNDILSSTDDIIFVTDFKVVTFSNRKFKEFFIVKSDDDFNDKMENNIIEIFSCIENYLHKDLLDIDETFPELIARTSEEFRAVNILNKNLKQIAFNINITKTTHSETDEYLVTLTNITKLKEKEKEIQKKAYVDGLTHVYNRNKFNEIIEHELKRDIRYKRNLSVAIIDIDNFKHFNDTYGHLIGDEVLIMLANYLNSHLRDTDTFARWGGEEFVILFPETNKEIVQTVCEKLRYGVEQLSHPKAGNITASFGVSQYIEDDTLEILFKRCDDALYEAKENGRNMVCVK